LFFPDRRTRFSRDQRQAPTSGLLGAVLCAVFLLGCWHSTGVNEPRFEARAWLLENKNPSALAGTRFVTTAGALRFVDRLIAAGAESVFVTGVSSDPGRLKAEGGPHADALVIVLPEDEERREELFRVAQREAVREGLAPEQDKGQREIVLWWD